MPETGNSRREAGYQKAANEAMLRELSEIKLVLVEIRKDQAEMMREQARQSTEIAVVNTRQMELEKKVTNLAGEIAAMHEKFNDHEHEGYQASIDMLKRRDLVSIVAAVIAGVGAAAAAAFTAFKH